jgi:tRNA(Arg) A34 adenosine deaminase TadA
MAVPAYASRRFLSRATAPLRRYRAGMSDDARALADPGLDAEMLQRAVRIAAAARARGDHPFGSLLADASGAIVLEAGNTVETAADATGHAETNLVRLASRTLTATERAGMTLYTSTEPCAMCAAAIHWARIGAVVYALPEAQLVTIRGDQPSNPTMNLPCR